MLYRSSDNHDVYKIASIASWWKWNRCTDKWNIYKLIRDQIIKSSSD